MGKKAKLTISGLLLAVLGILFGPAALERADAIRGGDRGWSEGEGSSQTEAGAPATSSAAKGPASTLRPTAAPGIDTRLGFTSKRALEEHYEKHGSEFGSITRARYLYLAQELRDAPKGGDVLEAQRADGVITRFDKLTGAFVAFNADRTIRTFFRPNDGLRYFERQLEKEH